MGIYQKQHNDGMTTQVAGRYTVAPHDLVDIPDEHHKEALAAGLVLRRPSPKTNQEQRSSQAFEAAVSVFEAAGRQTHMCNAIRLGLQAKADGRQLDRVA